MAATDDYRHTEITEAEYAAKAFPCAPNVHAVGDTVYVHIPSGVRAVRITAIDAQPNGNVVCHFENLTSP